MTTESRKLSVLALAVLAGSGIAAPATADKGHKQWIEIQSVSPPIHKPGAAPPETPGAFGAPPAAQGPAPLKNQSTFRKSTGSEAAPLPVPAGPKAMQPPGGSPAPGAKAGGLPQQPEMVYKTIKIESPPGPRPLAAPAPAAGAAPSESMSLNYEEIKQGAKPPAGAPGSVQAPNKDPQGAALLVPAVQSARDLPPKPPAK